VLSNSGQCLEEAAPGIFVETTMGGVAMLREYLRSNRRLASKFTERRGVKRVVGGERSLAGVELKENWVTTIGSFELVLAWLA
jgi:hypothetical protein